jgi:TRAP transporter 4TM/12TM fusion protein
MAVKSIEAVKMTEGGEGRYRHYTGATAILIKAIAVALPIFVIQDTFNLQYYSGFFRYYRGQYNALFLGFVLVLIFFLVPATKNSPRTRLPWYDALFISGSLAGTLYIFTKFESITLYHSAWATFPEIILGLITLIVILEGARRTTGWAMVILVLFFLFYARFGYLLPNPFYVPEFSLSRLMATIYVFNKGIFSSILEMAATLIIAFVLFGSFLQVSGGGNFFIRLALALVGRFSGGPAKVAVISSAFFGTISGSPSANVAVTGSITIPLMKSIGYKSHFAGAVEATASTGGALMPPVMGVVAFLIADTLGVSYGKVALSAVIPAILYFVCVFLQVHFQAINLGLRGLPPRDLPPLANTLKEGWLFLLPIALLVLLMMVFQMDPLLSVMYALAALIFVSVFKKETRIGPKKLLDALEGGSIGTLDVGVLCALAGVIAASLSITALGLRISSIIIFLSRGELWALLLLAAVTCYILGMGISSIAAYILLSILVAPSLVAMGVPAMAANMFIFYMGLTTFITPPFAPAVYVACGIAKSPMFHTGFQAMRLGIVMLIIPFMFVYRPAMLMIGTPAEIVVAGITGIMGAIALAAAIEGRLIGKATWHQRIILAVSALSLIMPGWQTDVTGTVLFLSILAWQKLERKRVETTRAQHAS